MSNHDFSTIAVLQHRVNQAIAGLDWPSHPSNLYQPIVYTLEHGGKRLRPVLCLLGEEAGADLDGVPVVGVAGAKGGDYPVERDAVERGVGVSGEFGHADGGHACAEVEGEAGKSGEVGGDGERERV